MKRVTKKKLKEVLESFTGWDFTYTFKERPSLVIFSHCNHEAMTEALEENGISVDLFIPPHGASTGKMHLSLKE